MAWKSPSTERTHFYEVCHLDPETLRLQKILREQNQRESKSRVSNGDMIDTSNQKYMTPDSRFQCEKDACMICAQISYELTLEVFLPYHYNEYYQNLNDNGEK